MQAFQHPLLIEIITGIFHKKTLHDLHKVCVAWKSATGSYQTQIDHITQEVSDKMKLYISQDKQIKIQLYLVTVLRDEGLVNGPEKLLGDLINHFNVFKLYRELRNIEQQIPQLTPDIVFNLTFSYYYQFLSVYKEIFNEVINSEKFRKFLKDYVKLVQQVLKDKGEQQLAKISYVYEKFKLVEPQLVQELQLKKTQDEFLESKYNQNKLDESKISYIEASICRFVQKLGQVDFQKVGLADIEYQYFGSQLNGFATASSDVDFTILTNNFINEREVLKFIWSQLKLIEGPNSNYTYNPVWQEQVRIPLLNVKELRSFQIDIDLCINNILGAINTQLLKKYSMLHEKIKKGGILIKIIGKLKEFQTKDLFSSYALILMFLYFLQQEYKLPRLQVSERKEMLNVRRFIKTDIDEFSTNCYFVQDENTIREMMKPCIGILDSTPLYKILQDFFIYFRADGKFMKYAFKTIILISSKNRIDIRSDQPSKGYRDQFFSIVDPFDEHHDPGDRIGNPQQYGKRYDFIFECFEKCSKCFQTNQLDQLFEPRTKK